MCGLQSYSPMLCILRYFWFLELCDHDYKRDIFPVIVLNQVYEWKVIF